MQKSFFQTTTENLRCCSIASTMPCYTSLQDKRVWKWKGSGIRSIRNSSAIMAPKWLPSGIEARTKTEVYNDSSVSSNEMGANVKKTNTGFRISILNMEYVIRNMPVLISCQEPSFSDIIIMFWITKTTSPRS